MSEHRARKALEAIAATPPRERSPETEAELIGADAACRILGVHRNTLYRLIRSGDIPALRLTKGGRWRFMHKDLLDWLEAKQTRRFYE